MPSGVPLALHGGQDGPYLPWTLLLCVGLLQIHFSSTAQQFSEHQGLRAPLARTHVASLLPQHWPLPRPAPPAPPQGSISEHAALPDASLPWASASLGL